MKSKYIKFIVSFLIVLFLCAFLSIEVQADTLPVAVITMTPQENITTNTIVDFSADSSIPTPGNTITATSWGGDYSLTGLYTAGEHTVTLTVKDSSGATSVQTQVTFNVIDPSAVARPVAVITMTPNTNITNFTHVTFSHLDSITHNGEIKAYEWEGVRSQYPVGIHTVKLRVQDYFDVWSEWAEVTFTVTQDGYQTEIPTGNKYVNSMVESSGEQFKLIDETKFFDLSSLNFTVRYGDDTTKTISVFETDASMDYKYKDVAYLTADKKLIFYKDAEYGDYVNVTFTYTERNREVKTNVQFKYERSANMGLITNVSTNITEVQIPKDEIFHFKDILFKVSYDNGFQETIEGNKFNYYFSEEFKKSFYIDDSDYLNGIKITPMVESKTGDGGFVEFYVTTNTFHENPLDPNIPIETFKKYIKFTIIDESEEYITEDSISYISPRDTVVGISEREKLELTSLEFIAHLNNGQIRKLYYSNFLLNIQYKYKQLIEYDEINSTIKFKQDTPYGTEIILNFTYNYGQGTKHTNIKLTYVDGTPNYGSDIVPLFTDINGHWAQNDIIQMSLKGKVVGYDGNSYFPDRPVTRAEVASFISKYLELDKKDLNIETSHFTDVLSYNHYYYDIEKVYASGVFLGYDDGTFLPDASITRQELAVVLYRTYQYKTGLTLSGNNTPKFVDDGVLSDWARDAIYSAKALGLINGRPDGKFHPLDNTTRAEITAILNRMLNNN